jgi:hypothetical protein
LHEHNSGVVSPWSAKVGLNREIAVNKLVRSSNLTELESETPRTVDTIPALSGDSVLLAGQGPTREDSAILENCGSVTEYEINSSEYL